MVNLGMLHLVSACLSGNQDSLALVNYRKIWQQSLVSDSSKTLLHDRKQNSQNNQNHEQLNHIEVKFLKNIQNKNFFIKGGKWRRLFRCMTNFLAQETLKTAKTALNTKTFLRQRLHQRKKSKIQNTEFVFSLKKVISSLSI